jgi:hypothetical protein
LLQVLHHNQYLHIRFPAHLIIIILTKVGSLIAIILVFWYTIAPRSVQTAQAATLTDNPISFALPTPAYADISD